MNPMELQLSLNYFLPKTSPLIMTLVFNVIV